jgi:hypothetical protein
MGRKAEVSFEISRRRTVMHETSEMAQEAPQERAEDGRNDEPSVAPAEAAPPPRETKAREESPTIDSPPTSPQSSPWWTAPGGKAVDIPDFGHVLFDALAALLAPAPQPMPIRIRARR